MIKKCTASALILGLALSTIAMPAAATVCDSLLVGDVPGVPKPAASDPPNISSMPIQVYTTVDPDFQLDGITPSLTHKCAVASDLSEVDVMMEDAGFGGYTGPNVPLVESARIKRLASVSDRNLVRAVAWAVMRGDQEAEEWIAELKADSSLYSDSALNVYFVHYDAEFLSFQGIDDDEAHEFEIRGMHLRDADGETEKMIFYGDAATPSTLAHEFGHAFSNGHVNFYDLEGTEWCTKFLPHNKVSEEPGAFPTVDMDCEFDLQNYMWAGSEDDRQFLGGPQTDRMRRNKKSIMYQFHESETPLDCPDFSSDPKKNTPPIDDCKRLTQ